MIENVIKIEKSTCCAIQMSCFFQLYLSFVWIWIILISQNISLNSHTQTALNVISETHQDCREMS
jgi:hypothetical protein